ncbi:MAG: DUF423 domain-containing protein [Planctomycetota bacterium]|nr:DUF423 domain-containing protein [Planctomycetota bacterium]
MNNTALRIGAISAFLAVALGAFGAHYVKDLIGEQLTEAWQTAVRYQFLHALAILVLAINYSKIEFFAVGRVISWFAIGTILFSGSLYVLSLTGIKAFGPVTPVGGVCFLVGWFEIVLGTFKVKK